MDRLKLCMDALRSISLEAADPNWYPWAERQIVAYLNGSGASLPKLQEAFDREAEASQHYVTFWNTMQEFVSTLRRDEK